MDHTGAGFTASLHRRFRQRLMVNCVDLMECLPRLQGPSRKETLGQIRETTHQMAGSAGAFGFDLISALALAAEDAAKGAMASPGADPAVTDAVRRLCAEVAGNHGQ